jgi:hypothetical protein
MTRSLELPEGVYNAVIAVSRSQGVEPAEWIASHLPLPPRRRGSEAELKAARELLFAHTFSLGHPTGTDNEQIDADLAREYGDSHEPS